MPVFDPGHTSETKRQFAQDVRGVATATYAGGLWTGTDRPDTKLVEVWERSHHVTSHISRNRFFWVANPEERRQWHRFVVTLLEGGYRARERRGVAKPPVAHRDPTILRYKPVHVPGWARPDTLIGYTAALPLQPQSYLLPHTLQVGTVGHVKDLADVSYFPSIYYQSGHATMDHRDPGNVGFEFGDGWKCLFFGNVPRQCLKGG